MAGKNPKATMAKGKKGMLHTAILCALMLMLLAPQSSAYFYKINPQCSTVPCISGQPMNWTFEISNNGMRKIEYVAAEVVDSTTDQTIAAWEIDFQPLSSDRGPIIAVSPTRKVDITVPGIIPRQHYNNQFYYYPCFTHIISDSQTLSKYGEYTFRHCYKENDSIFVLGCTSSTHCSANEICGANLCKPLVCDACQYIENHACQSYGCCADDDCAYDFQCSNHTCTQVLCLETQYLFNRTCVDIKCEENEVILSHSCTPLQCADDEGYVNHTCQKLECADGEFISEHRCAPLNCAENEYPQNHLCNPLECSSEQGYKGHQCYDLECYPFQTIDSHQCRNEGRLIIKLSVEVIIVLLIIAFIALDIYKYRRKGVKDKRSKGVQSGLNASSLEEEMGTFRKK
jgi:hypothetical protein